MPYAAQNKDYLKFPLSVRGYFSMAKYPFSAFNLIMKTLKGSLKNRLLHQIEGSQSGELLQWQHGILNPLHRKRIPKKFSWCILLLFIISNLQQSCNNSTKSFHKTLGHSSLANFLNNTIYRKKFQSRYMYFTQLSCLFILFQSRTVPQSSFDPHFLRFPAADFIFQALHRICTSTCFSRTRFLNLDRPCDSFYD